MKIRVVTSVRAGVEIVKSGFNENLFRALNPPFPPVKLLRFDGCRKEDIVSLQLNFILFKQTWTSEIVEELNTRRMLSFTDTGVKLPFFLSYWKHQHVILSGSNGSNIVDYIEYKTGRFLTDILMYPLLLAQFLYRRPIYRKIFGG